MKYFVLLCLFFTVALHAQIPTGANMGGPVRVSQLPACDLLGPNAGRGGVLLRTYRVTDAASPSLNATVAGGGSSIVTVVCDGSNWLVTSGAGLGGGGGTGLNQLTGDVTAGPGTGSQAATVVNLPSGVTQTGYLAATAIAAPGTPAAGLGRVYVDSTSKNIAVKDDAGVVKHGVQTDTGTANNYISAISDAGAITKSRPACATLSDSAGGCSMSTTAGGDLSGTLPSPTVAKVNGTTVPTNAAADQLLVTTASATALWKTLTSCTGTSKAVTYDTSSHAFGCNTITGTDTTPRVAGVCNHAFDTATLSSVSCTGTLNVAVNDIILACLRTNNATVITFSDTAVNTWTAVAASTSYNYGGSDRLACGYTQATIANATDTVTATYASSNSSETNLLGVLLRGNFPASAADAFNTSSTSNGQFAISASFTPAQNDEIGVIFCGQDSNAAWANGTNGTLILVDDTANLDTGGTGHTTTSAIGVKIGLAKQAITMALAGRGATSGCITQTFKAN